MTPKEKKEAKLALAPVVASLTSRKTTYLPKMPSARDELRRKVVP